LAGWGEEVAASEAHTLVLKPKVERKPFGWAARAGGGGGVGSV
jgi:hypothetical protein